LEPTPVNIDADREIFLINYQCLKLIIRDEEIASSELKSLEIFQRSVELPSEQICEELHLIMAYDRTTELNYVELNY